MLPGFFLNKLSSPPNVKLPPHSCCAPAEQRLADQLPKQKRLEICLYAWSSYLFNERRASSFGIARSDTVDERMGSERLQSNDVVKQRTCTLLEHLLIPIYQIPVSFGEWSQRREAPYFTDAERAAQK